jgi:diguanylate cyclase (GGDEF)-like protein
VDDDFEFNEYSEFTDSEPITDQTLQEDTEISLKKAKKKTRRMFFARSDLVTAEAIFLFYTLIFAIVHLLIFALAMATRAFFAGFYQAIPICWYVYLYCIKGRAFEPRIYGITVFEMIANAFVCTVFIGGGYGFFLYLLIVPANSYFMNYHIRKNDLGEINPITPSLVSLLAAIGIKLLDGRFEESAHYVNSTLTNIVYSVNLCVFFGAIVFIMLAFYASMNAVEQEIQAKNELLARAANTDFLTGALNRRSFTRRFRTYTRAYSINHIPFCAVMCDIDDFKAVNDTYGHDIGDIVIVHAVAAIKKRLGENDVMCRWGGEEFLLIISGVHTEDALPRIEEIRAELDDSTVDTDKGAVHFTMTFGMANYHGGTMESLVNLADDRLYFGKTHGKNMIVIKAPDPVSTAAAPYAV